MITRLSLQLVFLFLTVAAQVAGGGRFADENGREQIIETTDSHPFWVVTDNPDLSRAASEIAVENGTTLYHENISITANGYWVEAKDLREGDVFIGTNGELSTLVNKERVEFPERITVYNFTVDGNHDYFVIAETGEYGQTCVLVHNAKYVDNILSETNIIRNANKNRCEIRTKNGNMSDVLFDFYSLNSKNITERSNGSITGILEDGTKVNIHKSSSTQDHFITLEIQTIEGTIKIRYQP